MVSVTIDSGAVEAGQRLRSVPRARWRELMVARRHFLEVRLPYDCRCLVQFVNDAELMYRALGFESVEQMIEDGYGLEPAEIKIAVRLAAAQSASGGDLARQCGQARKAGQTKEG
jgi:hypothetical protein